MPPVSCIVRDADPEQPISNVRTLEKILQANTAPRFVVRIIAAFAAPALLLAGIGLHGLLSFTASWRRVVRRESPFTSLWVHRRATSCESSQFKHP